ncbi:class I SAM-dependent methyltransferase [Sorangium sp. So ce233]|uniref:class I SAM-dependent methyltransferase n=1 Tax=Sorangium sp. So ce233 TaxID=3133290 RepID=UPI003F638023
MNGPPLSAADAVLFEHAVVPRYISFFASLAVNMLLPSEAARIVHFGCRSGFPDPIVADKLPGATLVGVDGSAAALDLARAKAALFSGMNASYVLADALPTPLPSESFSHAFTLHPVCRPSERAQLLAELRRVLVPGGQALIALPLRGSFPEVADIARECALKQDLSELGAAVDAAAVSRPTIETIAEEIEGAGFDEVEVDVQLIAVSFDSGREFLEDPISRLMVIPEATAMLDVEPQIIDSMLKYLHHAVSKYWSEGVFELTVNVGCASARRPLG